MERARLPTSSHCALALGVPAGQIVGRAGMAEPGFALALELRDDALGQDLAEFYAPLIERVDVPNRSLGEHAVLVQRHEFSERGWGQTIQHDGVRRPIAFEHSVWDEPIGHAFGLDLLARFAEGERLGLCKYVGQQHIVMSAELVERLGEGDEVAGVEPRALVIQLIERVLAIGSRITPIVQTVPMLARRTTMR